MKLRGMREKSGTFTDKKTGELVEWHNVYLSVTREQSNPQSSKVPQCWGDACEELKIRFADLEKCFGKEWNGVTEYEQFKDCDIEAFYDRFGNVIGVKFL